MKSSDREELKSLVRQMESDYWLVRHFIVENMLSASPAIKEVISAYDEDLNEFAWLDRVVNTVVPLIFEDGQERHYCPVCGEGTTPTSSVHERNPAERGYTELGLRRHLEGFGRQSQCQGMLALKIATRYCIAHENKYPSPLKL